MSRASRDKGARIEREIVARHAELGVKAERALLSGDSGAVFDGYAFWAGLGTYRKARAVAPRLNLAAGSATAISCSYDAIGQSL